MSNLDFVPKSKLDFVPNYTSSQYKPTIRTVLGTIPRNAVIFLVCRGSRFAVAVAVAVQDSPFVKAAYREVDRDRTAIHRDLIFHRGH